MKHVLLRILYFLVLLVPMGAFAQTATQVAINGSAAPMTMANNTATIIDPNIVITADGDITGFTVTITGSYTNGDLLSYTGALPTGISTSGFNTSTRTLQFQGTASPTVWQDLLRRVTLQTTSATCFPERRDVAFNFGLVYYNPVNGHFYLLNSTSQSWTSARNAAAGMDYFGYRGYLTTVTSASENAFIQAFTDQNSWIGCSDNYLEINAGVGYTKYAAAANGEGNWHWVTGPETGTPMRTGNASINNIGPAISGVYQNWANNEPNDYANASISQEDYGHMYNGNGLWNDFPNGASIKSLVEFGGLPTDLPNSTPVFTREIQVNGAPTSSISGGNISVCPGGSASLSLSGLSGSVIRWEWSADNFLSSVNSIANTSTTLSLTGLTETRYYRAIVNTTSPSCSNLATSSTLVEVNNATGGNVVVVNPTICPGGYAELFLFGNEGSVIEWQRSTSSSFGTYTSISETSTSLVDLLSTAGTYYYRAVVQNASCGSPINSGYAPITVTAGTPPVGGTVSSVSHCGGSNSGTLSLSGYTGSITKWQYSTNNGLIWTDVSNTTTSLSYSNITASRLYRAVLSNGSCGLAYSEPGEVLVFQFSAASNSPLCVGSDLQLGLTITGESSLVNYSWSGPNGFASNDQNPSLTDASEAAAGTYTVSLTAPGCTTSVSTYVHVGSLQPLTLNYSGNVSICEGETIELGSQNAGSTSSYVSPEGPLNGSVVDCNCPAGYVAVGYTGRSGGWLDQIQLACKPLNPDGTLGSSVVYTSPNGGNGGAANGPYLFSGNDILVGMHALQRDNVTFYNIAGYKLSTTSVDAQADPSTGTLHASVGNGTTTGTYNDLFVPAGAAVTGMRLYYSGFNYASTFGLNYVMLDEALAQFSWSTGSTANTIQINAPGTYSLTYANLGCSGTTDPIVVSQIPFQVFEQANLVAYATDQCGANVAYPEPVDTVCIGTVSYDIASGSFFATGEHTVTQTTEKYDGSFLYHSFTVTVLDTLAPDVVSCPSDIQVSQESGICGATVTYDLPEFNDGCETSVTVEIPFAAETQTWVVPEGVTELQIEAAGGSGARAYAWGSDYSQGGAGGVIQTTVNVTPGQVLYITTGGSGNGPSGGYNGGGNAGYFLFDDGYGGGGGGHTSVGLNSDQPNDFLLVVAGGGGAAVEYEYYGCNDGDDGGNAGFDVGDGGRLCYSSDMSGEGATPYDGGAGYEQGGFLQGGNAGTGDYYYGAAGGGGSGYYGGGSGYLGGGGGGSSFVHPDYYSNAQFSPSNYGDGYVRITYLPVFETELTAGLASGSVFPVGSTTVTYTRQDVHGNVSTCSFDVEVLPLLHHDTVDICATNGYLFNGQLRTVSGVYSDTLSGVASCDSIVVLHLTLREPSNSNLSIAQCVPYTLNGTTYTSSGVYTQVRPNAAGCDSTITLNLTILSASTASITALSCNAYTLNGTEYTESGVYTQVRQNLAGCDSTITLNLTILEPTTASITESACVSYSLNGTEYTESGVYTQVRQNLAGCDSTITLNLTILEPTSASITESACVSYTLNGTEYTESGVYTQVRPNLAGCDSTITLNLTILEPTTASITESACVSYSLNGTEYTESGVYTQVRQNLAGCDSTITLNLTILEPTTASITGSACVSYTLNGTEYTESGVYTQVRQNLAGCDSTITLNLTILEPSSASITASACVSYTLNGTEYTESGVYTQVRQNLAGCDSTITLNLTILEPTTASITESACVSYSLNGTEYTESGVYTQVRQNLAGCDSTITLNLTILEPTTASITESACVSYSLNGTEYTVSGVYTQVRQNLAGCDSTITLNLTILEPTTASLTESACVSYSLNGTEYTESGVYTQVRPNLAGCDSTITLNLTILEPTTASITESACVSYTLNGTEYTESGVYTQVRQNLAGCDSIITLNLTILEPTTASITESACVSYSLNGTEYTESGVYTQVRQNLAGCDSTITLNLTILEPSSATITESACVSYTLNGTEYTESGVYTQVRQNLAGCDSTLTLNLTILEPSSASINASACVSYTLNGQTYTESGTYVQSLQNAAGCDSTLTLNLSIGGLVTSSLTEAACESYTLNGETFIASGVYTQSLQAVSGCDSLLTLNLTILEPSTALITESACVSYTLNGTEYTESGVYTQVRPNLAGCDSTITLNLTILEPSSASISASACVSYTLNGTEYTESGVYTQVLENGAGCDSTITLNLTILEPSSASITASACVSYTLNGQTYTESGTYVQNLQNAAGCDSTLTLNLSMGGLATETITASSCASYDLNGTLYTENGVYTQNLQSAGGCDSVLTLNLTILEATEFSLSETACGSFTLNNQTYTSSGIYVQTLENAAGCDSVITLNLNIVQPSNASLALSACGSYVLNGQTYTSSGIYTQTLQNAAGCDSVITLNLSILEATSASITQTACGTFVLNGQSYSESGVYQQILQNVAGCDSILTLNLNIGSPSAATLNETHCGAFSLNGQTYTQSGVYTQTLQNAAGCDSVITLNLIVNAPSTSNLDAVAFQQYTLNGQTYTESGTFTQQLTATNGCDSTLTLNLIITAIAGDTNGDGVIGDGEVAGDLDGNGQINGDEVEGDANGNGQLDCEDQSLLGLLQSAMDVTACHSYTHNNTTYTESGTYVQTFVNDSGCVAYLTLNITILDMNPGISQQGNQLMAAQDGVTYQWINCQTGVAIDGATSQSFVPTQNGYYAVVLDNGICELTTACAMVTNVGIETVSATVMDVFPNPSEGQFTIRRNTRKPVSYEVLDARGRLIMNGLMNDTQLILNLDQVERGVYMFRCDGQTLRLVKQ